MPKSVEQPRETRGARGRPAATSADEIERAAFRLFEVHGFEATTLTMISDELGLSRRTITRYFPSKNDIPWGHFDSTLPHFSEILSSTSPDQPLWSRIHEGVVRFNDFPDGADPSHRTRMGLIYRTPSLQAHSALRNQRWRSVVEVFVAEHLGADAAGGPLPRVVGHVSMALATAAYEQWLESGASTHTELVEVMNRSMTALRQYVGEGAR